MNKKILNALKPLAIPVSFQVYDGPVIDTWITFFNYDERNGISADDRTMQEKVYVQVDVWSKRNYSSVVDYVQNALENVGFAKVNAVDLYEKDSKIYHKAMRFVINKEV